MLHISIFQLQNIRIRNESDQIHGLAKLSKVERFRRVLAIIDISKKKFNHRQDAIETKKIFFTISIAVCASIRAWH